MHLIDTDILQAPANDALLVRIELTVTLHATIQVS